VNPSALLLIIVAFGFLYFVLVRPQKRRQAAAAALLNAVKVGDEIVTAGGMYGEVTGFQDDDVLLRIAPGLEVRIARRAVGAITNRADDPEEADEPEEHEEPEDTVEEPVENLSDPHASDTAKT
jgi:preprotein translocase subunit YajC